MSTSTNKLKKAIKNRVSGSNTKDKTYTLTIEALDSMLGGNDVTQQRLESLNFKSSQFSLLTLDGIDFIGVSDPALRKDIETISLQSNQLTTLQELVDGRTKKPLFPNLSHVFAPDNFIAFICARPRDVLCNTWPTELSNLVELDLSGNMLTEIPSCANMPRIRRLRLSNNMIRPPWKQLKLARELEELDLSANFLDWTNAEFMLEVKVLRELRVLRQLNLRDNPFCLTLPDYLLFCLKELASSQEMFLGAGSKTKYFISEIDGIECNEAMYDRAMAIKHPDRKRREFLGTVGLNGNSRLIDLQKEVQYLREATSAASSSAGVAETKGNSIGWSGGDGGDDGDAGDAGDDASAEAKAKAASDQRPLGAASKADTETSLYKLIMLADLCTNNPTSVTPAISMMLKYCKKLRDRDLDTGPSYLFDDLIPPTEQATEARRQPYQELAANRFTQSIFVLTQRLPHMLTSLTSVLGYLAAVPEGDGILGKRCMATLTHMSTGGLTYERAVLHAVERCVTTQLLLFDRPSSNKEEDEEDNNSNGNDRRRQSGRRGNNSKKKKKKKKRSNTAGGGGSADKNSLSDARHDTLIAGVSGFVAA